MKFAVIPLVLTSFVPFRRLAARDVLTLRRAEGQAGGGEAAGRAGVVGVAVLQPRFVKQIPESRFDLTFCVLNYLLSCFARFGLNIFDLIFRT